MFRRHIVVLRDGLRLPEINSAKRGGYQKAGGAGFGFTPLLFRRGADRLCPKLTALFCATKVDGLPLNNNHFQSRTQNGHPYPARQRATLQPVQSGGRGKS